MIEVTRFPNNNTAFEGRKIRLVASKLHLMTQLPFWLLLMDARGKLFDLLVPSHLWLQQKGWWLRSWGHQQFGRPWAWACNIFLTNSYRLSAYLLPVRCKSAGWLKENESPQGEQFLQQKPSLVRTHYSLDGKPRSARTEDGGTQTPTENSNHWLIQCTIYHSVLATIFTCTRAYESTHQKDCHPEISSRIFPWYFLAKSMFWSKLLLTVKSTFHQGLQIEWHLAKLLANDILF